MSARFAYDDVPYDSEANADTHPSAMATLARLCGLEPPAPSTARVLEIGCGNGENLLAAAAYLPDARFVGFDLAAKAIEAGIAERQRSGLDNVELFAADISELNAQGPQQRENDFVVAHGMYSWVPEPVRADLLALTRASLAPSGIGFVSVNALPGWELRRALREIALDRTQAIDDPAAKVAEALRAIAEIERAGKDARGFLGALSASAREYLDHIERATPPEAPFCRYVFHDLLAEVNTPFSVAELRDRFARAGLRLVCEAPLRAARATAFEDLETDLASTGTPFLQVLVQRDDAPMASSPDPARVGELFLWADLTPMGHGGSGGFRTTTGALVRPEGEDGLARATQHAPGFVPVADLTREAARDGLSRQLFQGFCEGVFTLVTEPPRVATSLHDRPSVARHVRARAAAAVERGAASLVVTNALHRSFRVPRSEAAIIQSLNGARTLSEIATESARLAGGPIDERFVAAVLDRLRRHLFLIESEEMGG